MATPANTSGGSARERIAALVAQFKQLQNSATSADRSKRGEVLDDLQEAVGLSGRMVTEQDILRQAGKMLASP